MRATLCSSRRLLLSCCSSGRFVVCVVPCRDLSGVWAGYLGVEDLREIVCVTTRREDDEKRTSSSPVIYKYSSRTMKRGKNEFPDREFYGSSSSVPFACAAEQETSRGKAVMRCFFFPSDFTIDSARGRRAVSARRRVALISSDQTRQGG